MGTKYGQLTESERCEIFRLRSAGISCSEIGRLIGRDKGTISRELRRNALPKSGYAPLSAERIAFARRRRRRKSKIERSSQLLETVRDQLIAMGRSPEQIAGRLKLEQGKPVISHKSIYRFIHGEEGHMEKLHRIVCVHLADSALFVVWLSMFLPNQSLTLGGYSYTLRRW